MKKKQKAEPESRRKSSYKGNSRNNSKSGGLTFSEKKRLIQLKHILSGKVMYDDPKRVAKAKDVQPKEEPAKKAEKCTTNTDNVDREIEKLKEEKEQLEQQIKAAAGDKEKVKVLEKKLAQIEGELSQKDNDTYRRKNAVIS